MKETLTARKSNVRRKIICKYVHIIYISLVAIMYLPITQYVLLYRLYMFFSNSELLKNQQAYIGHISHPPYRRISLEWKYVFHRRNFLARKKLA
jgi:hypothetical protein